MDWFHPWGGSCFHISSVFLNRGAPDFPGLLDNNTGSGSNQFEFFHIYYISLASADGSKYCNTHNPRQWKSSSVTVENQTGRHGYWIHPKPTQSLKVMWIKLQLVQSERKGFQALWYTWVLLKCILGLVVDLYFSLFYPPASRTLDFLVKEADILWCSQLTFIPMIRVHCPRRSERDF